MIAVVSSTVHPSPLPSHDGVRTTLTPEVRLEHTQATIASLVALGVREILITDNSAGTWLRDRAAALAPARLLSFSQPPLCNKGLGEMWLLLGALPSLPEDEPILKISGRYCVGRDTELRLRDGDDVAGKVYGEGRGRTLSTRCYLLRNRDVATRLWERTLDEMYAQVARVHGPRSFWRILKNSLTPAGDHYRYSDPHTAVETAIYQAIQHLGLKINAVEHLAVEGILGKWDNSVIKE